MPEYLAPGVYVEETSYRAKSIEGVATSTTGFVGPCQRGPTTGAHLVTSFEEFKRRFGGLEDLEFGTNYLAHAARVFFDNGGKRLYVARVVGQDPLTPATDWLSSGGCTVRFQARSPGRNLLGSVRVTRVVSGLVGPAALRHGDLVLLGDNLCWIYRTQDGECYAQNTSTNQGLQPSDAVRLVTLTVEIKTNGGRERYVGLSTHHEALDSIQRVLDMNDPASPDAAVGLDLSRGWSNAIDLCDALSKGSSEYALSGGGDGRQPTANHHAGAGTGKAATGLAALAQIDDIAIVAAPACASLDAKEAAALRDALITHCEALRYRVAILSAPRSASIDAVRELRGRHDSSRAALYYPWVTVRDPNSRSGRTLDLPPDGFIAGIYARSDVERGVHKAPANEVVRGALDFSELVSTGQQEVLNPEGINCLRFFEGRGYRVWGGRTISSDPEWKYINVRRLFNYIEHSIDKATQWVVFEPNNEALWLKVRLTVESFLTDVWRSGALMGTSPKEAFFVRCDETTMTQGDLDNGRLICLIGVAPTKPAEFVIFRIGQWTADASIL